MGTSFSRDQIGACNDKIEKCLENPETLKDLKDFVKNDPDARKAIDLWEMDTGEEADCDALQNLSDEIDSFSRIEFKNLEPSTRKAYITSECCRILSRYHEDLTEHKKKIHDE